MKTIPRKNTSFLAIILLVLFASNLFAQNSGEIIAQGDSENKLIKAVLYKGVAEVEKVLAEGVDINQQDESGYTALIWACSYSSREVYRESAKLLISKGADVNIRAKDGTTALIESAAGSPEIFNLLIEKGADISLKKDDGTGPLYNCLASVINYGKTFTNEYMKIIDFLISNHASVDESPVSGELKGFTPLIYAARDNYLEIAEFLIEQGANVNSKNVYDQTPLSVAEQGKHTAMVKLLKSHGAK